MMNKIIAAVLLLICSTASANHKVIREPDTHSDRHTRGDTRIRDNRSSFNGLYITPVSYTHLTLPTIYSV